MPKRSCPHIETIMAFISSYGFHNGDNVLMAERQSHKGSYACIWAKGDPSLCYSCLLVSCYSCTISVIACKITFANLLA